MIIKHGRHICFEEFTTCAKVCGLLFLDCASRVLIGSANKLRSHGRNSEREMNRNSLFLISLGTFGNFQVLLSEKARETLHSAPEGRWESNLT